MSSPGRQKRAQFDFEVEFLNGGGHRPVHTTLLRAGIPIVEHMRGLELLPATGPTFTAVPPKVKGMGTFPVRAFATLPGQRVT